MRIRIRIQNSVVRIQKLEISESGWFARKFPLSLEERGAGGEVVKNNEQRNKEQGIRIRIQNSVVSSQNTEIRSQ